MRWQLSSVLGQAGVPDLHPGVGGVAAETVAVVAGCHNAAAVGESIERCRGRRGVHRPLRRSASGWTRSCRPTLGDAFDRIRLSRPDAPTHTPPTRRRARHGAAIAKATRETGLPEAPLCDVGSIPVRRTGGSSYRARRHVSFLAGGPIRKSAGRGVPCVESTQLCRICPPHGVTPARLQSGHGILGETTA